VPRGQAFWTFASDLVRTRHYDCFDRRDPGPFMAELRNTATSILKSRNPRAPATYLPGKEH